MVFSQEMNEIISVLRALNISRKDAYVTDLMRDFFELEGHHVPFKQFGFSTLEEFLRESGEFVVTKMNGQSRVFVKMCAQSGHINKFVQQQKTSKKTNIVPQRKLKMSPNFRSSAYSNVYSKMPSISVTKHINQYKFNNNVVQSKPTYERKLSREDKPSIVFTFDNIQTKSVPNENMQSKCSMKQPIVFNNQPILQRSTSTGVRPPENLHNNLNKNATSATQPFIEKQFEKISNSNHVKKFTTVSEVQSHDLRKVLNEKKCKTDAKPKPNIVTKDSNEFKSKLSARLIFIPKNNNPEPQRTANKVADTPGVNKPTVTKTAAKLLEEEKLDAVTELEAYCRLKMLESPKYTFFKLKKGRIQCRIKINESSYSTYPQDFSSEATAKIETAKHALDRFKMFDHRQKFPLCMDTDSEIVLKMYESLKISPHGVFSKKVPETFQSMYQQSLPEDWFRLVVLSPQLFSIEESVLDCKIIYTNDIISAPIGPYTSNSDTHYSMMDKLSLPWHEKYWNLYIENPKSTVDVWGRLVGADYSDKLDSLMIDIELSFMTEKNQPAVINVGHIYIVIISECIYRVRVDRNDYALKRSLCFLIDVGDDEWFPMDQLYICDKKFLKFPAQAVCFSLFGLEDCADNPNTKTHLHEIIGGKTLIGDILTNKEEYIAKEESSDMEKIELTLYDTRSEEDICLNPMILERICKDTPPPILKACITNVIITHIAENGYVYCQIGNSGIYYIEKLIHHLTGFGFKNEQHQLVGQDTKHSVLYLIYDKDTKKWYRASVVSTSELDYTMFCVDFGMTKNVSLSLIYRLDLLSVALNTYPHQAIKVSLYGISKFDDNIIASLKGYLNSETQAVVKVIVPGEVPQVNIYKRFEQNSPLSCINESLLLEQEMEKTSENISYNEIMTIVSPYSPIVNANGYDKHTTNSICDMTSQFKNLAVKTKCTIPKLEACALPTVAEFFNVHVTMSSNPGNFTVRPYTEVLQDLMMQLQSYCANCNESIDNDSVEVEQAYAALYTDKHWYRVIVENIIDTSILVYYCDYGDIVLISSEQLKPLPAIFRTLPRQAMAAKLHGIKPKNTDWEMEDCVHFQQLTVNKKFASCINNINHEEKVVLELTLIDVTSDIDININEKLVNEGRAIQC